MKYNVATIMQVSFHLRCSSPVVGAGAGGGCLRWWVSALVSYARPNNTRIRFSYGKPSNTRVRFSRSTSPVPELHRNELVLAVNRFVYGYSKCTATAPFAPHTSISARARTVYSHDAALHAWVYYSWIKGRLVARPRLGLHVCILHSPIGVAYANVFAE